MALNFPGPGEVRLFYTTQPASATPITHVAKYNVSYLGDPDPGDEFSAIQVIDRLGVAHDLDDVVDTWVTQIRPLFGTGGGNSIDYAEFWIYTAGTFDAHFVSSYTIGLAGTSGSAVVSAGQSISTFRTQEGGIFKIVFLESVIQPGFKDTAPFSNAALEAIRQSIVAGTTPWLARDTSFPFASIAHYPGQSEHLFKIRNGRAV